MPAASDATPTLTHAIFLITSLCPAIFRSSLRCGARRDDETRLAGLARLHHITRHSSTKCSPLFPLSRGTLNLRTPTVQRVCRKCAEEKLALHKTRLCCTSAYLVERDAEHDGRGGRALLLAHLLVLVLLLLPSHTRTHLHITLYKIQVDRTQELGSRTQLSERSGSYKLL